MTAFPYPTPASVRAEWNAMDQRKANQAADRFELTEVQFNYLAHLHVSHLAQALQDMVQTFDFDRRPTIGVYGSVSDRGIKAWQDEWLADLDSHMKRAWDALKRANERFGKEAA